MPTARTRGVIAQRLHHDPDRVGEVDQQRLGRDLLDQLPVPDHRGDRPQRHREPAGAGRLLAEHAVLQRHLLVDRPRAFLPGTDRGEHEPGALDRRSWIRLAAHRERRRPIPRRTTGRARTSARAVHRPGRAARPRRARDRPAPRPTRAERTEPEPPSRAASSSRPAPFAHAAPSQAARSTMAVTSPAARCRNEAGSSGVTAPSRAARCHGTLADARGEQHDPARRQQLPQPHRHRPPRHLGRRSSRWRSPRSSPARGRPRASRRRPPDGGSLNPRCPLTPIPRIARSIPPRSSSCRSNEAHAPAARRRWGGGRRDGHRSPNGSRNDRAIQPNNDRPSSRPRRGTRRAGPP